MDSKRVIKRLKDYKKTKRKLKGGAPIKIPDDICELYGLYIIASVLKEYLETMNEWCSYYFQRSDIQTYLTTLNLLRYFQSSDDSGKMKFTLTNFMRLYYENFDELYTAVLTHHGIPTDALKKYNTSESLKIINSFTLIIYGDMLKQLIYKNPVPYFSPNIISIYFNKFKHNKNYDFYYFGHHSLNDKLYTIFGLYCLAAFNFELFETMKQILIEHGLNSLISFELKTEDTYDIFIATSFNNSFIVNFLRTHLDTVSIYFPDDNNEDKLLDFIKNINEVIRTLIVNKTNFQINHMINSQISDLILRATNIQQQQ